MFLFQVFISSVIKLVRKLSNLDTLIKTLLVVKVRETTQTLFHYNALEKFILTLNILNPKI